MNSGDTVRILQLAALSSVIDGQATEQEVSMMATLVAKKCDQDATHMRAMAEHMVTFYGKNSNPIFYVRQGKKALNRLSGRNKKLAMDISKQVAEASDGVNDAEANFLKQLAAL